MVSNRGIKYGKNRKLTFMTTLRQAGGGSFIVCVAFSSRGKSPFVVLHGWLTEVFILLQSSPHSALVCPDDVYTISEYPLPVAHLK
ncbi:transposable element Tc3 Transposase [Phytophthora palmivora]|uniref:Transposable element Tc3 Transposase n=1 Tax=Phytophthora palmivora TaxID=4796 RepID=A0A2P4WZK0_9STRA|nr:transposable element Tc3 Transposase [Phytophthora palmivora]